MGDRYKCKCESDFERQPRFVGSLARGAVEPRGNKSDSSWTTNAPNHLGNG